MKLNSKHTFVSVGDGEKVHIKALWWIDTLCSQKRWTPLECQEWRKSSICSVCQKCAERLDKDGLNIFDKENLK